MDFEAERKKRLEVLEEKKKRLEEMKRIKQDRENTANNNNTNTSQTIPSKERDDVDNLVNSLLLSSLETPSTTVDLSDQDKKLLNESATTLPNKQEDIKPTHQTISKPKILTITKSIASLEILPYIHESYDKTCQTDEITEVNSDIDDKYTNNNGVSPHKLAHRRPATARRGSGTDSNANSSINTNLFNTTSTNAAITSLNNTDNTTPRQQPSKQHISDDDIHRILSQPSFHSFLEGSSTLIERAMGQSDVYDILKNYQDSKSLHNTRNTLLNKVLLQIESYEDSSIKHRPIMDLAFSPHHPELFLVAYGSRNATTSGTTKKGHNSDHLHLTSEDSSLGMVCIWSTAIHHKPEFKFHSTSPVLTARFHESDEHIVIGGCYTGQVIQWDLRTKSLPVQRSSLTGKGHKHPIYSMAFSPQAPTSNQSSTSTVVTNAELVTISVDGIMCHWDLSRLSEPTNIINLQSLSPPPLISTPFISGMDSSTGSAGEGGSSGGGKAGPMPLNVTSLVFGTVVTQDKQTIHEVILGTCRV